MFREETLDTPIKKRHNLLVLIKNFKNLSNVTGNSLLFALSQYETLAPCSLVDAAFGTALFIVIFVDVLQNRSCMRN